MTDADKERAAGEFCYCGHGRIPSKPSGPIVAWFAAGIALVTLMAAVVSGYADLRQEIVAGQVSFEIRISNLERSEEMEAGLRFDERDARALIAQIDSRDAALRQFARTNCLAISNLQIAAGLPITNDCERP